MANPRWLVVASRGSSYTAWGDSNGNSATGVFEVARDFAGDTAAGDITFGPPAVWMNLHLAATTAGGAETGGLPVSYARRGNLVGVKASAGSGLTTIYGGTAVYGQHSTVSFMPSVSFNQMMPNQLAAGANYVFTVYPNITQCSSTYVQSFPMFANGLPVRGRLYGLKAITRNQGVLMDTIDIKIDANYFHDETQSAATHYVLANLADSRFALPA